MKAEKGVAPETADKLEDIVRESLEERLSGLASEGKPVVLAAVSGGVDSMVMLSVLHKLKDPLSFDLHAVTVNHNIRPEEETAGDAALVKEYCAALGVPCTVTVLARNEVRETSLSRDCGTEEAARFLRYAAFESAAAACAADIVCIAHNRNDRLETLVARFLQGASGSSASGMKQSRGMYFRPLFNVTRREIEAYAACKEVPFRTDATNADNRYYRNRIRNELMPLLDSLTPGWDTAVLHGAEKNALVAAALEKHASAAVWEECGAADDGGFRAVSTDEALFCALEPAERIEALYQGLYLLNTDRRVPYGMLRAFSEGERRSEGAGISLERERGRVIIRKENEAEIDGFFCVVKECGRYVLPWGEILIRESKDRVAENAFHAENIENGAISGTFTMPVIIRSRQPSDRIRDKDGGHKEVSKLFSEWHIPEQYEARLPVFDNGEVLGVWGGVFNYPDYFIKPLEDYQ